MYRKIIQEGFRESYNFIGSSLVDMYANCGLLEEAQIVLMSFWLNRCFVGVYLLQDMSEHGHYVQALYNLEQIQKEGISMDIGTFAQALKACASLSDALEDGNYMLR